MCLHPFTHEAKNSVVNNLRGIKRPFAFLLYRLTTRFGQITWHGALHAMPDSPALFAVCAQAL